MCIQFCTKINLPAHFEKYDRCVSIKQLLVPLQRGRFSLLVFSPHSASLPPQMYRNDRGASGPSAVEGTSPPHSQHHSLLCICSLALSRYSMPLAENKCARWCIIFFVSNGLAKAHILIISNWNSVVSLFPSLRWMWQTLHFLSWPLELQVLKWSPVEQKFTYLHAAVRFMSFPFMKCYLHESYMGRVMSDY